MFGLRGRTKAEQQRAVDDTRTMAIQQLLLIEWRGSNETDHELRLNLTEMLEEADACGRVLQRGELLGPDEFDGLLKIHRMLRNRRASAVRASSMPPPPKPRSGIPPCRLVRSR